MAAPLSADRELAKELWLNGFSINQISAKINVQPGTVYQWKRRNHWDTEPRTKHSSEKAGVQAVAERLSLQAVRIVEQTMSKIENSPPKDLRDCKDAASALAAAYATARKALNMDEGGGAGRAINVSIYAQSPVHVQVGSTASDLQSEGQSAPVIDVEQVTEAPKQIPTTGPTTDALEQPGAS